MKIIIVGAGKVGYSLAEQLSHEQHDVTVVDTKEASLRRAGDMLDVMTVSGNAISAATLKAAGADSADLLVAATNADEINMICCLTAKNMGTKYTIARIRNPEYTASLAELRRNLKIDMVINPESATANEIARLLRFPSAANIDTFCRGRVELMGFRLQKDDFMVGKALYTLSSQIKKLDLLFCAVERGGQVTIPNGSFIPEAGDKLYLIGRPDSMDQFFRVLGRYAPKIRQVMVVGGGKISNYLIERLDKMNVRVKIIERSEERCRQIHAQFPRVMAICGDGTDQEFLDSENLASSDAFVALTDQDENNLIISLYAMQQGLPKVITKCNRFSYAGIVHAVGLDSIISPKSITASHILRLVRGMQNSQGSVMNSLHRIADGAAEAAEFTVNSSTKNLGIPLKDLSLKPDTLIAVIVRGQDVIIPEGTTSILSGDRVIVISKGNCILDLNDIYREVAPPTAMGGLQ